MLVYVIAGILLLALIVFFVMKKKPDQAPFDSLPESPPEIEPPLKQAAKAASPRQPGPSAPPQDQAQVDASVAEVAPAPVGQEPASPAEGSQPAEASASEPPEDDIELDAAPETEEAEIVSPPPPPHREGTPIHAEGVGRKAELQSLRKGLAKSRQSEGFFGRLKGLFAGKKEIAPDIAEEIEEVLLTSDVGVATTESILDRIKERLSQGELKNEAEVWEALREEARRILSVDGRSGGIAPGASPTVVLMVGVNGAGKTTTIGKLASQFSDAGKKVMLAAGDTFRAAAVDQLKAWGDRVGCEVVTGKENADPSSVLYDAITTAQDSGTDVLLADTAGRLHTKTNLMQEMSKIEKTAGKALPGAPHEVLLVIDSTNGQNAMAQAREFKQALNVTGLILTKLDGTARGGAVLGICDALQLPVRYIGVGERTEDLYEFDTYAFVEALLGSEDEEIAA